MSKQKFHNLTRIILLGLTLLFAGCGSTPEIVPPSPTATSEPDPTPAPTETPPPP